MCVCVQSLSRVWLFAAPWTVVHQVLLSVGFPRQEYWNELPFPTQGTLSDPGIELTSLASPALAGEFFTTSTSWKAPRSWSSIRQVGLGSSWWVDAWGLSWGPIELWLPSEIGQSPRTSGPAHSFRWVPTQGLHCPHSPVSPSAK